MKYLIALTCFILTIATLKRTKSDDEKCITINGNDETTFKRLCLNIGLFQSPDDEHLKDISERLKIIKKLLSLKFDPDHLLVLVMHAKERRNLNPPGTLPRHSVGASIPCKPPTRGLTRVRNQEELTQTGSTFKSAPTIVIQKISRTTTQGNTNNNVITDEQKLEIFKRVSKIFKRKSKPSDEEMNDNLRPRAGSAEYLKVDRLPVTRSKVSSKYQSLNINSAGGIHPINTIPKRDCKPISKTLEQFINQEIRSMFKEFSKEYSKSTFDVMNYLKKHMVNDLSSFPLNDLGNNREEFINVVNLLNMRLDLYKYKLKHEIETIKTELSNRLDTLAITVISEQITKNKQVVFRLAEFKLTTLLAIKKQLNNEGQITYNLFFPSSPEADSISLAASNIFNNALSESSSDPIKYVMSESSSGPSKYPMSDPIGPFNNDHHLETRDINLSAYSSSSLIKSEDISRFRSKSPDARLLDLSQSWKNNEKIEEIDYLAHSALKLLFWLRKGLINEIQDNIFENEKTTSYRPELSKDVQNSIMLLEGMYKLKINFAADREVNLSIILQTIETVSMITNIIDTAIKNDLQTNAVFKTYEIK
jgi:hypothetical protein